MSDIALPAARARSASPALLLLRRLVRRRLVLISLFILLVMLVAAVGAPWLAPYSPRKMDIAHRLAAPSAAHWFGTDEFGRDVLTRCMYGAQLSLTVGFLVVLASLTCGTVLGVVSGYVRQLDGLLMRVTDALMAFPDILLAIALMAALGASLTDVVIALGTVYTPRVARVARGATLVLRELQFIEAAEALGASGKPRHRRAPAAEPAVAAAGAGHVRVRVLHPDRGGAVVPRRRRAADQPDLGQHDRRRAGVHAECRTG